MFDPAAHVAPGLLGEPSVKQRGQIRWPETEQRLILDDAGLIPEQVGQPFGHGQGVASGGQNGIKAVFPRMMERRAEATQWSLICCGPVGEA